MTLVAPINIIFVGSRDRRVGSFFGDEHDSRRVAEAERAKQNRIDNGEDGSVRADAKGERQNGDKSKTGTLGQEAERVTKILQQSGHGFSFADRGLAYLTHAAVERFSPTMRTQGLASARISGVLNIFRRGGDAGCPWK